MDLKSISLQELETAIAAAIRDLLGEKYVASIEKVDFATGDERAVNMQLLIREQKYKPSEFSE